MQALSFRQNLPLSNLIITNCICRPNEYDQKAMYLTHRQEYRDIFPGVADVRPTPSSIAKFSLYPAKIVSP